MSRIKTVCIVSLSSGVLGESFVKHELDLGVRRMEAYGLKVTRSTRSFARQTSARPFATRRSTSS